MKLHNSVAIMKTRKESIVLKSSKMLGEMWETNRIVNMKMLRYTTKIQYDTEMS